MTLDEIYETFMWRSDETQDEYEERIADAINEAKKYKYLHPFSPPLIPGNSISVGDPCARVIALKSDEELYPYLPVLFEWLQDINWPGATIIFDRLLQMPFSEIEKWYYYSHRQAEREVEQEDRTIWLLTLDALKKEIDKKQNCE